MIVMMALQKPKHPSQCICMIQMKEGYQSNPTDCALK